MSTPEALAVDAALVNLESHFAACCRANAKHSMDEPNLCPTGKGLFKAFDAAERAHRIAQWGDDLPVMADRPGKDQS